MYQNAAASPAYFPSHVPLAAANLQPCPGFVAFGLGKMMGGFAPEKKKKKLQENEVAEGGEWDGTHR